LKEGFLICLARNIVLGTVLEKIRLFKSVPNVNKTIGIHLNGNVFDLDNEELIKRFFGDQKAFLFVCPMIFEYIKQIFLSLYIRPF